MENRKDLSGRRIDFPNEMCIWLHGPLDLIKETPSGVPKGWSSQKQSQSFATTPCLETDFLSTFGNQQTHSRQQSFLVLLVFFFSAFALNEVWTCATLVPTPPRGPVDQGVSCLRFYWKPGLSSHVRILIEACSKKPQ